VSKPQATEFTAKPNFYSSSRRTAEKFSAAPKNRQKKKQRLGRLNFRITAVFLTVGNSCGDS